MSKPKALPADDRQLDLFAVSTQETPDVAYQMGLEAGMKGLEPFGRGWDTIYKPLYDKWVSGIGWHGIPLTKEGVELDRHYHQGLLAAYDARLAIKNSRRK
jgi:hypothetical protein